MLSFALPEFTNATTAALSQWHSTLEPAHCRHSITMPSIMGSSSFGAIDQAVALPSHFHWNQWDPQDAPQPQDPEASYTSGVCWGSALGIREMPFQCSIKQLHHRRSERTVLHSLIQWSLLRKEASNSNSLHTNVRPGCTTVAACWRCSTRHSRSCFLCALLSCHSCVTE